MLARDKHSSLTSSKNEEKSVFKISPTPILSVSNKSPFEGISFLSAEPNTIKRFTIVIKTAVL
jgi:hypothetical protein